MSIYKYMSTHVYNKNNEQIDILKYIFEDKVLWFSSPLNFNDPFELKPHIQQMIDDEQHPVVSAFNNQLHATNQVHEVFYDTVKPLLGNIGILCLSGTIDHFAMWAHYADDHKGIVVEFLKEHPFFQCQYIVEDSEYSYLQPLRKVHYTQQRRVINSNEYPSEEDFLTKSLHWQYEDEYRMGVVSNAIEEEKFEPLGGIQVNFPNDLVSAVYLGNNVDDGTLKYFLELKKDDDWKHLKIFKMDLDKQHYKLNPRELN